MLYLIKDLSDKFFHRLNNDPVRPHIPHAHRVGQNKDIFVLRNGEDLVQAITCVSYQDRIPSSESELFDVHGQPDVAVFYTIWSYQPGAGRQLIFDSVEFIQNHRRDIQRFATLSPKTEMAKKFHLKNGAQVYRDNAETVNYEYIMFGSGRGQK